MPCPALLYPTWNNCYYSSTSTYRKAAITQFILGEKQALVLNRTGRLHAPEKLCSQRAQQQNPDKPEGTDSAQVILYQVMYMSFRCLNLNGKYSI